MSTAHHRSERRRRISRRRYHDEDYEPRGKSRWPRTLLLIGALAGALWFSPSIVAHTPLCDTLLNRLARGSGFRGSVECGSASLGWLSPITLRDVEVEDHDRQRMISVPRLSLDVTLASLIWNKSHFGQLELEKPKLDLVIAHGTSNLEQAIADILARRESSSRVDILVEITDGSGTVIDKQSGRTWQLSGLNATLDARDLAHELALAAKGTISGPDNAVNTRQAGNFECHLAWHAPGASKAIFGSKAVNEFSLVADRLPMSLAEPFAQRYSPQARIDGTLKCDIECEWHGDSTSDQRMEGQVEVEELFLAGPWINDDRLQMGHAVLPCRMVRRGDLLEVEELALRCDLGNLQYKGAVDLAGGIWQSLQKQNYNLQGDLDLAKLARSLPHTIHVHDGITVTGGQVRIELVSEHASTGQHWQGRIETTHLTAVDQGKDIRWDQPVLATFEGRDTSSGLVLDHLNCKSSFLEIEAAGTRDHLDFASSFDLDQLAAELRRFVDLRDIRLAGSGWSKLTWHQRADGRFDADGEVQVRDLDLTTATNHEWKEENLLAFLEFSGHADGWNIQRVDTAKLDFESGHDRLDAVLKRPVNDVASADASWPVSLVATGDAGRWLSRIEPWTGKLIAGEPTGPLRIESDVVASKRLIDVARADLKIDSLTAKPGGREIVEPQVIGSATGRWYRDQQRIAVDQFKLASTTLSANGSFNAQWGADTTRAMTGNAAYVADLARLYAWTHDAPGDKWKMEGHVSGRADVSQSHGDTLARLDAQVDQFAIGNEGHVWREPQMRIASRGQYLHESDTLACDEISIISNALDLNASGRISDLGRRRMADFRGRVNYDSQALEAIVHYFLGDSVHITGRDSRQFAIRGPLTEMSNTTPQTGQPASASQYGWVAPLVGDGSLGWQSMEAYGFKLGQGELRGMLDQGALKIAPIDLALNGGRLRFDPLLRLTPDPVQLSWSTGRVLDNVQVTKQMCDGALRFIAPVLAGVTTASGSFSLDLNGATVPIQDMNRADISGKFYVNQIEIGPGPLIDELMLLIGRPGKAKLAQTSVVPFRMVQGRIYHRDLQLVFPEVTVRTYGSVGLDESLALMAEMPVPPKWIGNNRLGEALSNKTIRVPIGGTLRQPKLDKRELEQLAGQAVRNTASETIFKELNNQLDKLFDRFPGIAPPSTTVPRPEPRGP